MAKVKRSTVCVRCERELVGDEAARLGICQGDEQTIDACYARGADLRYVRQFVNDACPIA